MLSSELVRSALESAPDAMVIADASGRIVFVNQQVTALFGYAPWELTGQKVECLLPERFRSRHVGHREDFNGDVRARPMGAGLDLFARRRDGTEFPVEISLSPIERDGETLVAAAVRDATERREVQAQLRRAREAADSASQAKSRFLAMASHDLRQPLQTLALLNGAMRRSTTDPAITDALKQQELAVDAMARLLNALLDISKLESGAIKPQVADFTVSSIFTRMQAEFEQLAAQKGLELKVESCDDSAQSDPALVSQLLRNLLSNAIKYTQAGWVRLRCRHEQAHVLLEVLDSGIGIPAADLPHIFEEFYQVGVPANTSRDGYGLGLSIVHRIADLLGVALEVRSEAGAGSAFCIVLPAAAAHATPPAVAARPDRVPPQAPAWQREVLLVEDDPAVRTATQMLLKVAGYATVTAACRSEALALLPRHPGIGLMIADYHLANGETGPQVISAVSDRLGRPMRAILISGDTSAAVKGVAHDHQRMRIASKPVNADELLALVQELAAP
jgi:PAS domain S-box-containing protein